jgi:hypothetical protein
MKRNAADGLFTKPLGLRLLGRLLIHITVAAGQ